MDISEKLFPEQVLPRVLALLKVSGEDRPLTVGGRGRGGVSESSMCRGPATGVVSASLDTFEKYRSAVWASTTRSVENRG